MSGKTRNVVQRDVTMATGSAPVPFSYERNISIFDQRRGIRCYQKHMKWPHCTKSPCQHKGSTQCLIKTKNENINPARTGLQSKIVATATAQWASFCVLPNMHYWCQVWKEFLQYSQRYSWFCDLFLYWNYLWHISYLTKPWISLQRKNILSERSFK